MADKFDDGTFRTNNGQKLRMGHIGAFACGGSSTVLMKDCRLFSIDHVLVDGVSGFIVNFGCHDGAICDSERAKGTKDDCIFMHSIEPFSYYPNINMIDRDPILHSNIEGLPKSVSELFQKVFENPPEVMMGG